MELPFFRLVVTNSSARKARKIVELGKYLIYDR